MAGKGVEPYPNDVTDEQWAFVLLYLLLCRESSPQRKHDLRAVFNRVRYMADGRSVAFSAARCSSLGVVHQQMQRWLKAGCFEMLVGGCVLASARVGRAQRPADGRLHR